MGVNSLPKTVTRQRRGCDLNPGPSAPESSMPISDPLKNLNKINVSSGTCSVLFHFTAAF